MAQSLRECTSLCNIDLQRSFFSQASGDPHTNEYFPFSALVFCSSEAEVRFRAVADGDSQEFQEVSRPVSWDKDYLTGS